MPRRRQPRELTPEEERFYAGFTPATIRKPAPIQIQVGDKVWIPDFQTSGTVIEIDVKLPWSDHCMRIRRDDGTGVGYFAPGYVKFLEHGQ